MYNCWQPRARHWGLALAGAGDSLGHEFSLWKEQVSQCKV